MILILEDSPDRVRGFRAVLRTVAPGIDLHIWSEAHPMIEQAAPLVRSARLVSLDHDLVAAGPDARDPGDGLMVARFLAAQRVACPVIVHTSNADRGLTMMGELQAASVRAIRVLPFGPEWIEAEWADVVRAALR